MGFKSFLAYTNPITIIMRIPMLCGIILSVITNNIIRDTSKVVKSVSKDVMD